MNEKRDEYTWDELFMDVALTTSLNMSQAIDLFWPFRKADLIHPYDALKPIQQLVGAFDSNSIEMTRAGQGLFDLLNEVKRKATQ